MSLEKSPWSNKQESGGSSVELSDEDAKKKALELKAKRRRDESRQDVDRERGRILKAAKSRIGSPEAEHDNKILHSSIFLELDDLKESVVDSDGSVDYTVQSGRVSNSGLKDNAADETDDKPSLSPTKVLPEPGCKNNNMSLKADVTKLDQPVSTERRSSWSVRREWIERATSPSPSASPRTEASANQLPQARQVNGADMDSDRIRPTKDLYVENENQEIKLEPLIFKDVNHNEHSTKTSIKNSSQRKPKSVTSVDEDLVTGVIKSNDKQSVDMFDKFNTISNTTEDLPSKSTKHVKLRRSKSERDVSSLRKEEEKQARRKKVLKTKSGQIVKVSRPRGLKHYSDPNRRSFVEESEWLDQLLIVEIEYRKGLKAKESRTPPASPRAETQKMPRKVLPREETIDEQSIKVGESRAWLEQLVESESQSDSGSSPRVILREDSKNKRRDHSDERKSMPAGNLIDEHVEEAVKLVEPLESEPEHDLPERKKNERSIKSENRKSNKGEKISKQKNVTTENDHKLPVYRTEDFEALETSKDSTASCDIDLASKDNIRSHDDVSHEPKQSVGKVKKLFEPDNTKKDVLRSPTRSSGSRAKGLPRAISLGEGLNQRDNTHQIIVTEKPKHKREPTVPTPTLSPPLSPPRGMHDINLKVKQSTETMSPTINKEKPTEHTDHLPSVGKVKKLFESKSKDDLEKNKQETLRPPSDTDSNVTVKPLSTNLWRSKSLGEGLNQLHEADHIKVKDSKQGEKKQFSTKTRLMKPEVSSAHDKHKSDYDDVKQETHEPVKESSVSNCNSTKEHAGNLQESTTDNNVSAPGRIPSIKDRLALFQTSRNKSSVTRKVRPKSYAGDCLSDYSFENDIDISGERGINKATKNEMNGAGNLRDRSDSKGSEYGKVGKLKTTENFQGDSNETSPVSGIRTEDTEHVESEDEQMVEATSSYKYMVKDERIRREIEELEERERLLKQKSPTRKSNTRNSMADKRRDYDNHESISANVKPNGKTLSDAVNVPLEQQRDKNNNNNVLEYRHVVADDRIKKEIEEQIEREKEISTRKQVRKELENEPGLKSIHVDKAKNQVTPRIENERNSESSHCDDLAVKDQQKQSGDVSELLFIEKYHRAWC